LKDGKKTNYRFYKPAFLSQMSFRTPGAERFFQFTEKRRLIEQKRTHFTIGFSKYQQPALLQGSHGLVEYQPHRVIPSDLYP
jgi:hypothetical protein